MSDPNDLQAFLNEAWYHLLRCVADSRSPARLPSFCTVSPEGKPEVRIVALRGAEQASGVLEVHTDIATAKVAALRQTPLAAFLIWVPKADLQIRLTASVEIQTGEGVEAQWRKVPAASRVSYGTTPVPGTPIKDVFAYEKPADRAKFAVLRCTITEMDIVHLGASHRRASFVAADQWAGAWLAP